MSIYVDADDVNRLFLQSYVIPSDSMCSFCSGEYHNSFSYSKNQVIYWDI